MCRPALERFTRGKIKCSNCRYRHRLLSPDLGDRCTPGYLARRRTVFRARVGPLFAPIHKGSSMSHQKWQPAAEAVEPPRSPSCARATKLAKPHKLLSESSGTPKGTPEAAVKATPRRSLARAPCEPLELPEPPALQRLSRAALLDCGDVGCFEPRRCRSSLFPCYFICSDIRRTSAESHSQRRRRQRPS